MAIYKIPYTGDQIKQAIKDVIDGVFSKTDHTHSASAITSGILPASRGGTGETSAKDAMKLYINSLDTEASNPQDDDYFIAQASGGSTTNIVYYRKKLSVLWNYIKGKADTVYAKASHNHSADNITSGTLPAERGGTGNTTLTNSMNALVNSLGRGTDTPTDNDYYVSQYAGGGDTTTTYHRRPVSSLWKYIKSKADSVYSASNHTHNLGSSFKTTEVAVTTNSISAYSYQSGASISMDAQSGYTAIGIVGWKTTNWRIRPTSHYIEDNTSLFAGFANTSTSANSAKITFIVLWAKNTI